MLDENKLIEIARELNELILKEKNNQPYNINLINELHINENAHSRILNALLQYSPNGRYTLLEGFVEMLSLSTITISKPKFSCEKSRIDLLIKEEGKYAIIVENKIYNAVDQDRQIERYIEIVKNSRIPTENIFLVYLTKDGAKEVSDKSLTTEAKKILNFKNEDSRFLAISYQHNILPWLEKDILPYCAIKEELLISALQQYIDYLKGYLRLKPEQILSQRIMNDYIMNKLDITSIEKAKEIRNNLIQLSHTVDNIINEQVNKIADERIIEPFKEFLKGLDKKISIEEVCFDNNIFRIHIKVENWEKCHITFNLEGAGFIYGICHIDVSGDNHISDEVQDDVDKLLFEKRHKSLWWPIYKYLQKPYNYNADSLPFWENLSRRENDNQFLEDLKGAFEEIYSKTKDLKL